MVLFAQLWKLQGIQLVSPANTEQKDGRKRKKGWGAEMGEEMGI